MLSTSRAAGAAVLVVDGIAESSTAWLGRSSPERLSEVEEIPYPHSIGILSERMAVYSWIHGIDACKVVGLAACGNAQRFLSKYDRLFCVVNPEGLSRHDGPPFLADRMLARFQVHAERGLELLFGPRRIAEDTPDRKRFADIAAGLQSAPRRPSLLCLDG